MLFVKICVARFFSLIFDQIFVMKNLKEDLFEACSLFVQKKLINIEAVMQSNRMGLENESKSSAGDKHETGRAMMHLEMEKASQQFDVISKMKEVLQKIDINSRSNQIRLGSLVETDQGSYFLSISAGQLNIGNKVYYAVSSFSPIGAILLGKNQGDQVILGTKRIQIISVI